MREAIEALKTCQRQLDADGCEVGVSRQALDETLALVEKMHGNLLSARRYVHAFTQDEGNHPQARDNANALIHQIDTAIAGLK